MQTELARHLTAPIRILAMASALYAGACSPDDAGAPSTTSPPPDVPVTQVAVGELTFNVRMAGPESGEVVVLLHGFPETSYEWRNQIEALSASGYRVIAPDQRGYSPGARPTTTDAYAVLTLASDVTGLMDALHVDHFHLVGHDWGAGVGWAVAIVNPTRVLTFTSISVPHPAALNTVLADPTSCQHSASAYFDTFVMPNSEDALLQNDFAGLRAMYAGLDPDAVREYLGVLDTKPALSAALDWYRANIQNRQFITAAPLHVAVPTQLIMGADDPYFCRDGADLTAQYVDGPYRLDVIDGVGHWVPELASDRATSLVLAQLAGKDGG
jgi:pimeloyl-ACP methyl ester carboxylesterase